MTNNTQEYGDKGLGWRLFFPMMLILIAMFALAIFLGNREVEKRDALARKACSMSQMAIADAQLAGYEVSEITYLDMRKYCPPEQW